MCIRRTIELSSTENVRSSHGSFVNSLLDTTTLSPFISYTNATTLGPCTAMSRKLGTTSLVVLLNAPVMEPGLTNHLPFSVRMCDLMGARKQ